MSSSAEKLKHASAVGAIFLVTSLPQVYAYGTNKITTWNKNTHEPCPSYKSKLLHTLIFAILAVSMMKYMPKLKSDLSDGLIVKYAVYSTLLYFLLSSSEVYRLTDSVLGGLTQQLPKIGQRLCDNTGCPTLTGVVLHTVAYVALLFGMMHMPKDPQ